MKTCFIALKDESIFAGAGAAFTGSTEADEVAVAFDGASDDSGEIGAVDADIGDTAATATAADPRDTVAKEAVPAAVADANAGAPTVMEGIAADATASGFGGDDDEDTDAGAYSACSLLRAAGLSALHGEYDLRGDTGAATAAGAVAAGATAAAAAAASGFGGDEEDIDAGAYSGCSLFRAAGASALHGEYDLRGDTGAATAAGAAAGAIAAAAAAASGFGGDEEDTDAGAYSGCSLLRAAGASALHGEYDCLEEAGGDNSGEVDATEAG